MEGGAGWFRLGFVRIREKLSKTNLTFWLLDNPAMPLFNQTICPISSDPFYIVTYYIVWVNTSWTHSTREKNVRTDFGLSGYLSIVTTLVISN